MELKKSTEQVLPGRERESGGEWGQGQREK
jgi:hypothetical protein